MVEGFPFNVALQLKGEITNRTNRALGGSISISNPTPALVSLRMYVTFNYSSFVTEQDYSLKDCDNDGFIRLSRLRKFLIPRNITNTYDFSAIAHILVLN